MTSASKQPDRSSAPRRAMGMPDDDGQNAGASIEWTLMLLVVVGLFYPLTKIAVNIVGAHFSMVASLNALPFP